MTTPACWRSECLFFYISQLLQALQEERDGEEETAEYIPIDSVDLTGEEEESGPEDQPSSPIVSPKRTGQAKKTSITPVLSKNNLLPIVLFFCSRSNRPQL